MTDLTTTARPVNAEVLQDIIALQAEQQPEATALIWNNEPTSYAELQARIQTVSARLAAEHAPGERIAVLAWNCPDYIVLMYAVVAARLILVPLNARLAPREWMDQLQRSGASRLLGQVELLAKIADLPEAERQLPPVLMLDRDSAQEDAFEHWLISGASAPIPAVHATDPAWLLFTSGSTGKPKGAILTHAGFIAALESAAIGRPVLPGDCYYYPFPLFHVAAHNVLLQHQYGAAVMLAPSFDALATLTACRDGGVTTLSLAPTMIAQLLDHPQFTFDALKHVRTIGYGAAAMPLDLLQQLQSNSDVGLCQSYGMTELCGSVAFLTSDDHREAAAGVSTLLRSVGQVLPTATVEVVNDEHQRCPVGTIGEIRVQARQCFSHYWQDPEATAATIIDGWLYTGDVGRFDEQGYLFIVDRKKDMVISGGENIASREVEDALRRHPAVKDCAVIGLPDTHWGEKLCAVLQLDTAVEDRELIEHCRAWLAGYKTPRRFERLEALPFNAAGKVDKPALRRRYSDSEDSL